MDKKGVIELSDSDDDIKLGDIVGPPASNRSRLDTIEDRVRKKKRKDQEKIDRLYTKRDVERAHGRYLESTYHSPSNAEAKAAVNFWANQNGLKSGAPKPRQRGGAMAGAGTSRGGSGQARRTVMEADSYKSYKCPVINCEVEFNSRGMFDMHMVQMQHSPCHPYNHLTNRELTKRITSHLCPQCGETYRDYPTCREHMSLAGHDKFYRPLVVVAYLCPTCLKVYPEKYQCRVHMEDEDHYIYKYSFEDSPDTAAEPVPLPESVSRKYLSACLEVPWHVECLDCSRQLDTNLKEDKLHHKITKHTLMSMSGLNTTEAFSKLMEWRFACAQCQGMFIAIDPKHLGDVHECSVKDRGIYIENDCKTFAEYVRRLGIALNDLRSSTLNIGASTSRSIPSAAAGSASSSGATTSTAGISLLKTPKRFSNYASLLSAASPEKRSSSITSPPEMTFDELKTLSSSESRGSSDRSTPEDTAGSSTAGAVGGAAPSASSSSQTGKTQEELDFEYAVMLSKKLNEEENRGRRSSPPQTSSQIEKDHAFAVALAEQLEAEVSNAAAPSPDVQIVAHEPSTSGSCYNHRDEARRPHPSGRGSGAMKRKASPPTDGSKRRREEERVTPPAADGGARTRQGSGGGAVRTGAIFISPPPSPGRARRSDSASPTELASAFTSKEERKKTKSTPPLVSTATRAGGTGSKVEPKSTSQDFIPLSSSSGSSASVRPKEPVTRRTGANSSEKEIPSHGSASRSSRGRDVSRERAAAPDLSVPSRYFSSTPSASTGQSARGAIFVSPPPSITSRPASSHSSRPPPSAAKGISAPAPAGYVIPKVSGSNPRLPASHRGGSSASRSIPPPSRPRDPSPTASGTSNNTGHRSQSDPPNLHLMKQIVFLDIDNWRNFFPRLPGPLPDKTFVWGFYGGATIWTEPRRCDAFNFAKSNGLFHLHNRCGNTKDAADFALCITVGRLDGFLPPSVAFTILSGDRGFCEVENQMKSSPRRAVVINPHHKEAVEVYALIKSVGEA